MKPKSGTKNTPDTNLIVSGVTCFLGIIKPMQETLFTKIIKGEIPSHKIYEDDKVYAFLDIHPIQPGHTLVIPKNPVSEFQDLSDEEYEALFKAVKKIAVKIKEISGKQRVCSRIEGFDVPHTHIHLYPCNVAKDFYGARDREQQEPDHEALANMAQKLKLS